MEIAQVSIRLYYYGRTILEFGLRTFNIKKDRTKKELPDSRASSHRSHLHSIFRAIFLRKRSALSSATSKAHLSVSQRGAFVCNSDFSGWALMRVRKKILCFVTLLPLVGMSSSKGTRVSNLPSEGVEWWNFFTFVSSWASSWVSKSSTSMITSFCWTSSEKVTEGIWKGCVIDSWTGTSKTGSTTSSCANWIYQSVVWIEVPGSGMISSLFSMEGTLEI